MVWARGGLPLRGCLELGLGCAGLQLRGLVAKSWRLCRGIEEIARFRDRAQENRCSAHLGRAHRASIAWAGGGVAAVIELEVDEALSVCHVCSTSRDMGDIILPTLGKVPYIRIVAFPGSHCSPLNYSNDEHSSVPWCVSILNYVEC